MKIILVIGIVMGLALLLAVDAQLETIEKNGTNESIDTSTNDTIEKNGTIESTEKTQGVQYMWNHHWHHGHYHSSYHGNYHSHYHGYHHGHHGWLFGNARSGYLTKQNIVLIIIGVSIGNLLLR